MRSNLSLTLKEVMVDVMFTGDTLENPPKLLYVGVYSQPGGMVTHPRHSSERWKESLSCRTVMRGALGMTI